MLAYIKDILYSKRKIIFFIIILLLLYFFFIEIASAAWTDGTATPTTGWTSASTPTTNSSGLSTFIDIVNQLIKVSAVFISLMTYLATMFLSPEWINWSLFWMSTYFRQIWILISNVVYLIFAFVLVFVAFMNIIWKRDNYDIKKVLPKFIVWILMVPLSWFMVQFVLTISSILTIAALNLPFDTFKDFKEAAWKIEIAKVCSIDLSSEWATKTNPFWAINCSATDGNNKIPISNLFASHNSSDSILWIMSAYTYWVMRLWEADSILNSDLSRVKKIWDLATKSWFDIIFLIVYLIIIVSLWIVLFTRWIYIWLYIMISPLFWLMYFFNKDKWGWSDFFGKFNLMEFVKLALVPVYAMAALSFGLLFIYVVTNWISDQKWSFEWAIKIEKWTWDNKDVTVLKMWDNWMQLSINWALSTEIKEFWGDTLWIIWSLIVKIFGILVLWSAVMAALKTSKITEEIIAPIAKFWSDVASVVKQAPMQIPILPGWASLASAWVTWWRLTGALSTMAYNRADKTWWKFIPKDSSWRTESKEAAKAAATPRDVSDVLTKYKESLWWDQAKMNENKEILRELLKSSAVNDKFKPEELKELEKLLNDNFGPKAYWELIEKLETRLWDIDWDGNKSSNKTAEQRLIEYLNAQQWKGQPKNPSQTPTGQPNQTNINIDLGKNKLDIKLDKDWKLDNLNTNKTDLIAEYRENRDGFITALTTQLKPKMWNDGNKAKTLAEEIATQIWIK